MTSDPLQDELNRLSEDGEYICTDIRVWHDLGVRTVEDLYAYIETAFPPRSES